MSKPTRDREPFARLPQSLLQHPAVTTLSHAAFRVLAIITVGARPPGLDPRKDPGRNGTQAVTESHAKKYGINGADTLYKAVRELIDRGLLIRTRDGHRGRSHFSLYAVSWLPITHMHGQILAQIRPAPNGHLKWTPPLKPKKWMPKGRKSKGTTKINHSVGRSAKSPCDGVNRGSYAPSDGVSGPNYAPSDGDTLDSLEGGTDLALPESGYLVPPSDFDPKAPIKLTDADSYLIDIFANYETVKQASRRCVQETLARARQSWRPDKVH